MEELERGLVIAGTGIGVVFAALVSLALVTMALGRFVRGPASAPQGADDALASATQAGDDLRDDRALTAAIVVAVRHVRRAAPPAAAPSAAPEGAQSAWRAQGRQALMASQGARVRRNTPRR